MKNVDCLLAKQSYGSFCPIQHSTGSPRCFSDLHGSTHRGHLVRCFCIMVVPSPYISRSWRPNWRYEGDSATLLTEQNAVGLPKNNEGMRSDKTQKQKKNNQVQFLSVQGLFKRSLHFIFFFLLHYIIKVRKHFEDPSLIIVSFLHCYLITFGGGGGSARILQKSEVFSKIYSLKKTKSRRLGGGKK